MLNFSTAGSFGGDEFIIFLVFDDADATLSAIPCITAMARAIAIFNSGICALVWVNVSICLAVDECDGSRASKSRKIGDR